MATWCQNNLTVSGQEKDVTRFVSQNSSEKSPLLFSKSIPEPDYLLEQGLNRLEEWRFAKWGTINEPEMRGSVDLVTQKNNLTATYFFWTISDPAHIWLSRVIEKYPNLSFCLVYGEENINLGGAIIAKCGRVVSSESGTAREYLDSF